MTASDVVAPRQVAGQPMSPGALSQAFQVIGGLYRVTFMDPEANPTPDLLNGTPTITVDAMYLETSYGEVQVLTQDDTYLQFPMSAVLAVSGPLEAPAEA